MNDDHGKAKTIFLRAAEIAAVDERQAYLAAACGGDDVLRGEVEDLLRHQERLGSFLEQAPGGSATVAEARPNEAPGTVIGPYKLLQQIGEGGMGTVFMAEQTQPVQRKVALKVIKPGMDSRQVIARFEAERQALAMMDHVNIARVFDGGATEAGLPYFVMELVHGVPITRYCDDNHLTPRERLELFVPVCQAIQHAHQKGIIHRDVKPSNVMVTLYDGKPVPKVIDFGVAKATEQKLTERTLFTQYGTMIGTLEYMSPEQAEMSALGVDTRSDIYSLGVLLYELLTGSTPLTHKRTKEAAYAEILRMIKEEEPPKPSTRLSDSGEALASISEQRKTEPAKLTKLMRGELDWIVMKTLEKDRNRRYETAKDFAADVQRYLKDEPVQASPPSVGYRLRKFARRNKGPVLAALVVLLALVVGIIGTTWGMLRATDAEAIAVIEAKQKDVALTDKEAALADAQDQLFLALLNRARAERSSGRLGQRFEALKAIRAAARIRITAELRTEAMAALVLPDAELAQEWERSAEDSGGGGVYFDASLQRYSRLEKQGGVAVCRVSNGREEVITRLPADGKTPVRSLLLSPDARFVACGHRPAKDKVDGRVRVWKLDGAEPAVLLDESPGINGSAWAFHPNGRHLAVGHANKSVSVYDLATGRRVQRLAVSAAPFHLAFHPREHRLAVACGNAVQLFDTETGKELPALRYPAAVTTAWHLTWHPDGRRLAVSCNDRKVHLWDTEAATEVMSPWTGHTADGLVVAFNHAGDRLASADWSGQVRLWDAATGRTLLTMPHWNGLQFSPGDRLLGPEYSGNKIRLWRLAGGRELRVLRPRSANSLDNITSPVVHADGRTLAAATPNQLCFFDLGSGAELASAQLPRAGAARPAFFDPPHLPQGRPDGKSSQQGDPSGGWMTGGYGGLCLWPARQDSARPEVMRIGPPQQIGPNPCGSSFSIGASASADGRVVAVPQGGSTLVLHRDRPDRRVVLGPQYDVRFSAVSPDGRQVVTCSWGSDGRSKTVRIWDADTGLPVHDLAMESHTSAKFSPDGRWLMTTGRSGVRQWEVGAWREVRHFDRCGFVFSPDSRLLAINDVFGVIRLLESTTGREVARLTGPDPTGYAPACFTPDGTQLVATDSSETALYVWDLRLIRQQLKELALDWDWPDFLPADPGSNAVKPRQVEVFAGDLAKPASTAWALVTNPDPSLRDAKRAVELAKQAVEVASQSVLAWQYLGWVQYRAGNWKDSIEALEKSCQLQAGGDSGQWIVLALAHAKLAAQEGLLEKEREYHKMEARRWYEQADKWIDNNWRVRPGHAMARDIWDFRVEARELFAGQDSKN